MMNNAGLFILLKKLFRLPKIGVAGAITKLSISLFFSGIINGAAIIVNQVLFNNIEKYHFQEETLLTPLLWIIFLVGMKLISQISLWYKDLKAIELDTKLNIELDVMLNRRIADLSAIAYEDSHELDSIQRASSGIAAISSSLNSFLNMLLYQLVYFLILGVFLYNIKPILLLCIFLVFIPVAATQYAQRKIYGNEDRSIAPLLRCEDSFYYSAMDTRETRLFGLFNHFKNLRLKVMKKVFSIKWKTQKKICIIDFSLNLLKVLGWIGILAILYFCLKSGEVTPSTFAAVFLSIRTIFSMAESLFNTYHSGITTNISAATYSLDFIYNNRTSQTKETMHTISCKGIQLSHVSFNYPNADCLAVNDVSLFIRHGDSLAIVGENGSGKTTLAKLICGLYVPKEGTVYIDGENTRFADSSKVFSNFSFVFQNFNKYGVFSLRNNVKISDIHSNASVKPALKDAEINECDHDTFPNDIETIMSREFGGINVSKGQWQRIAMARGIYRNCHYFLLDEPTASIDPFEEARVYRKFASVSTKKTTIFITHRMASARFANRIVVMEHGHITEVGTHQELLSKNGQYAKLWNAQAEEYVSNV